MRAAFALVVLLAGADAVQDPAPPAPLWAGSYECLQGETGLALHLAAEPDRSLHGIFHFYPLRPAGGAEGCFEMVGQPPPADGTLSLAAGAWLLRPPGYVTVDLDGRLSADGTRFEGRIAGPGCTRFSLTANAPAPALPQACRPKPGGVTTIAR